MKTISNIYCQKWLRLFLCLALVAFWPTPVGETESASFEAGELRQRIDPSDPVAGKSHWAFQPLSRRMPKMASQWSRSTIDDFVIARLRSEHLSPSPRANARDLVRRVYFQLIGLPPTPEQVQSFLDDERPDALERLVEQLIHLPQFGERWGRHWLDLARYADSNGLDENFLFREAWRYRNWVIDAVNADVPYDRFLLEQIAGDALSFEGIDQRDRQRIASGFLVVGPKVLLGNDAKRQRMEVADEQLDTIGRGLLGLTLGCARCHDHKFDPIPTADYYALAGILTSTEVMEQRHMLNQQRVMERPVGIGPHGDELDRAYEEYWRALPGVKQAKARAESALEFLKNGDESGLNKLLEKSADALAPEAKDASLPIEKRIELQSALIADLKGTIAHPPKIPPRAMIPRDVDSPADESIRRSGQFDRLGETVPRGFLRVVSSHFEPEIEEGKSGRVELGRWLTDVDRGAGRLAARVLANRIWHHLIGRGLVRTVDNFGRTGEPPTHPDLLDYLARSLIESGWSVKTIVREIVLSQTFAMNSDHSAVAHELDPDNRLLWRAHRRRLDPESMRDAMFAAAGQLDLTPRGSTVWYLGDQATAVGANKNRRRTDFPCRSVYLPVIRNDLPEVFDVFDFTNPHSTTGARPQTTVATQGLFMLNDEMVMDLAESMARRYAYILDEIQRLHRLFEVILNARATTEETDELLAYVRKTKGRLTDEGESEPAVRAWSLVCHAMFSMSRFQYLE